VLIGQQSQQIARRSPRDIPRSRARLHFDRLIFALAFAYLFVKVGAALGGGRMAGGNSASWSPFCRRSLEAFYQYFSVTYNSVGLITAESVFQIIAHAIEGAVAGATYK